MRCAFGLGEGAWELSARPGARGSRVEWRLSLSHAVKGASRALRGALWALTARRAPLGTAAFARANRPCAGSPFLTDAGRAPHQEAIKPTAGTTQARRPVARYVRMSTIFQGAAKLAVAVILAFATAAAAPAAPADSHARPAAGGQIAPAAAAR